MHQQHSQPIPAERRHVVDPAAARRQQVAESRNECRWCGRPFAAGFGVFCSRECARAEVCS